MPVLASVPMNVVDRLRAAGCVFAEEEAALLAETATSPGHLEALVAERVGGLPLEHVVGWAEFCGQRIVVTKGVFVPRHRTELLVDLAVGAIPLIGDVFDIVSRSNSANLDIFRRHALDPDASTAGHRMFFVGLVLMLFGAIWLIASIMARVFEAFWRAVLG